MQRVDPPAQVIEAFRDVQAARADQERIRNEAEAYANQDCSRSSRSGRARSRTSKRLQGPDYRRSDRSVATLLSKIYEEYQKAPDVTRERLYLETLEKVLSVPITRSSSTASRLVLASCHSCR